MSAQNKTFDRLLESYRKFREASPKPGSEDMIRRLEKMMNIYDNLGEVTLPGPERERSRIIHVLSRMKRIKYDYNKQDWDTIGRSILLYGNSPFNS